MMMVLVKDGSAQQTSNRQLYQTLDSLIEQYDQLTINKERRMENIKEGVRGINLTPEQQYDLNQRLYD
jgi:hypothetical protein